ncbi:TPA: hypothetical protein RHY76_001176 [Escherichia coli]|nr:hypothetical protein [Escherichia coli]HDV2523971.1 hypothetical protein [Escherichia coli]
MNCRRLRTIAATTWSEYKQYFERDAALERRFQMVKVDEPDDDTACLMLRGPERISQQIVSLAKDVGAHVLSMPSIKPLCANRHIW